MFFLGQELHDAAKIGPKSGNSGSRWRLEAILKRGWRLLAVSTRLVAVILPLPRHLEPSWGRLGPLTDPWEGGEGD